MLGSHCTRAVGCAVRHYVTCRKLAYVSTMKAWQAYCFGGPEQLTLSTTAVVPAITKPSDALIEVHAASINPIDTAMLAGYGSQTFAGVQRLTGASSQFPITLGRDFSGVVVDVAPGVQTARLKPGDEVWGVINPLMRSSGSHAEFVVTSFSELSKKPPSLSHIEAASIPYVLCTAWSSITQNAGLNAENALGKRVLIPGAAGGVGTVAIQLLKAWGSHVTAVCRGNAIELVLELGADVAIDYTTKNVEFELSKLQRFDFVFDCVKDNPIPLHTWMGLLKSNCNATYVSLNHSLLRNNDELGFPFGFAKSAIDYGPNLIKYKAQGKNIGWGMFAPSVSALQTASSLVEKTQMRAIIDEVFKLEDTPEGFRKVSQRHGRGKTVIDVKS